MKEYEGNILLYQISAKDSSSFSYKEIIPSNHKQNINQFLSKSNSDISWCEIDLSLNIIVNNKLQNTDIYYADGRVGISRYPLFNYKIDIAVPKDTLMTAFHIGDGSFGFSMGNGTSRGFIPEIIGIGSDENDAGLYFVGIAGNDISSNIPLIILDGRNTFNTKLINRPIFGITSANYNEYSILLDSQNNLNIKGNINVNDVILNNVSLKIIIKQLQEQIDYLITKIT